MTLYPQLITEALRTVRYAGTKKDLIESGMLEDDLRIEGSHVSFSLIFDKRTDPFLKSTVKAAETAIHTHISPDVKVEIRVKTKQADRPEPGKMLPDVKNIIVESGVTTIGNFAFFAAGYDLSYETVTIPDTVEYIGEDAFYSSKDLKSVEIPGSVKKIGIEAFSNSGIQALTLNEGTEKIMDRAFEYCINLKELVVPSTVNYTGLAAFADDSAIKSIEFKGSMIGDRVFAGCNGVITYTFGDNLSSVHNDAFRFPMEDCYFIKDNVSYGNPSADVLKGTTWTSNDGKTFYCSNTAGDMSDAEKYSVPISLGICALIPLFMLGGYMVRKF